MATLHRGNFFWVAVKRTVFAPIAAPWWQEISTTDHGHANGKDERHAAD
jgi:hypothetical protein